MVTIRLLILNSRNKLLLQKTEEGLQIPKVDCICIDNCYSLEDIVFLKLSSAYGITDIHPKDLHLYYFLNKINGGELFLDIVYKGYTRIRKFDSDDNHKFFELREIKKVINLFKDSLDEQIIRRFIVREDNPSLLCE